jgi:hypothetical protein
MGIRGRAAGMAAATVPLRLREARRGNIGAERGGYAAVLDRTTEILTR